MWHKADRGRWKAIEGLSVEKQRRIGRELGMTPTDARELDAISLAIAASVMLDADEEIALREGLHVDH